jgi:VWFA-related protein
LTPVASKVTTVIFLIATSAVAQDAPAPRPPESSQAQQPDVVFAARTDVVTVPVIVTDKKGNHIAGLKQSDFTIEENGHPRQIATFEDVSTAAGTFKPSPPSPYPFSNFAFARQEPRRVTIVVLDLLNTTLFNQTNVREQVVKFLGSHLRDTDPTSLTVLTSDGLRLVHSFTTDPKILLEALKQVESRFSAVDKTASGHLADMHTEGDFDAELAGNLTPTEIANGESSELTKLIAQQADASYAHMQQFDQTVTTLYALQELAQSSSGIPGRKSVIWASGGLPFILTDPDSLGGIDTRSFSMYEETWRALNDANVAVYPIDAHGLVAPNGEAESRTPRSQNNVKFPSRRSRSFPVAPAENLQDSLKAFANATGGKACYNRNDFDRCIALADEDSSQYYMLTYYLPEDDRKPGWRKLKVRVGAPHGEIRAREEFYVGEGKPLTPKDVQQEFDLAFSSPLDYTAVPLGWKLTTGDAPENGNRKVGFQVFLPPHALVIQDDWLKFNVHVIATDPKNKSILVFSKMFHAHLKPGAAADIIREGLTYKGDMTLAPGQYHLKLMVRDDFTGKFGSVQAPYGVN